MYVKVKAFPSSKKESALKVGDDKFIVHVKEPAERNLANGRITELIAREFSVHGGRVRIISGHRSPNKILSVGD